MASLLECAPSYPIIPPKYGSCAAINHIGHMFMFEKGNDETKTPEV